MADETVRPAWLTDACLDQVAYGIWLDETKGAPLKWDGLPEYIRASYHATARAALVAVAPFVEQAISAERVRLGNEIDKRNKRIIAELKAKAAPP